MEAETKPSTLNLFKIVKNLAQDFFKLVSDMTSLASLEARLAGKSLINIILLTFFLGTLFTSTWLCLLAFILYSLVAVFKFTWLLSLFLLVMINMLVILTVCLRMVRLKQNLFFPATRRQLKNAISLHKDTADEQSPASN